MVVRQSVPSSLTFGALTIEDVAAVRSIVISALRAGKMVDVPQMVAACLLSVADCDLPVSIDVADLSCGSSAHEASTVAALALLGFGALFTA